MAKNNKNRNNTVEVTPVKEGTMSDKVAQVNVFEEDSLLARVVGLGLVALGVVFVILAIVIVYLSRQEPTLEKSVQKPTIQTQNTDFNSKQIEITGKSEKNEKVAIYLNGREQEVLAEVDEDGNFSYELDITKEGINEIQAETIVGFPTKKKSEMSDKLIVTADFTAPSTNAELNYDPISTNGMLNVNGKTDPNTNVTIEHGEKDHTTTSDAEGNFEFKDIKLDAKDSSLNVTLEDKAGNKRDLAQKIEVTYPTYSEGSDENGDLNGDGAAVAGAQSEIPEAAGELSAALDQVFGNKLMSIFAIIALVVFLANSSVVALKIKSLNR